VALIFGGAPGQPLERNGGHEETRTPDLYRVKVRLTHTSNNFNLPAEPAKPL